MSTYTPEWTASTSFTRVLEALDRAGCRVEGVGRQRKAQCPHHADRDPSLSITDAASRVLLNCKAGCDTDDVLADLGLARRDLFNEPTASAPQAELDAMAGPVPLRARSRTSRTATRAERCSTSTSAASTRSSRSGGRIR